MKGDIIISNAQIEDTRLGIEDHGIFNLTLVLKWDIEEGSSTGQGFGGILDNPNKERNGRIGTAYGCEFIKRVLKTVGVRNWEDLKDKYVRIKHGDGYSCGHKIYAIGHIVENKWFCPEEDLKFLLDQTTAQR